MSTRSETPVLSGLLLTALVFPSLAGEEKQEPAHGEKPLAYWLGQLESNKSRDREQAIVAMVKMGTPVIPELVRALGSKKKQLSEGAAEALKRLGKDAVGPLVEALSAKDSRVRRLSSETLARIGPVAIPDLLQALRKRQTNTAALWTLSKMDTKAIPALSEALKDKDYPVRSGAAQALGWKGPQAKGAVGALVQAIQDEDSNPTDFAEALGRIGPEAQEAVPILRATLKNRIAAARQGAIRGLGGIGPAAKPAVPDLIKLLEDPIDIVRRDAANALRQIDPEAAHKAGIQ